MVITLIAEKKPVGSGSPLKMDNAGTCLGLRSVRGPPCLNSNLLFKIRNVVALKFRLKLIRVLINEKHL